MKTMRAQMKVAVIVTPGILGFCIIAIISAFVFHDHHRRMVFVGSVGLLASVTIEIRGGGRLRLLVVGVKEYILPNWDDECVDRIKIEERVAVTVWDCDTESKHQLVFNKETGTNATYGFIGQWTEEFVSRRGLKKNDEIGLYWDRINLRFCFSILNRASSD
ncbi:hypothetical protein SO802_001444 [Lithocarpus litseifolius]|uniref:Uncharacterized protein n=1 Tax=Lithocarpus litseifolius TaxID=425828 RepID=A0AAW2DYD7_9ROSI